MNNNLEKGKLGENSSQLSKSKSLISTISTGFEESFESYDNIIQYNPNYSVKSSEREDSIINNIDTGFGKINKVHIELKKPELNTEDFTIKFCKEDCKPPEELIFIPTIVIKKECDCNKNEDSILNEIDTGFGLELTITTECKRPEYKTHLYKESYLGEFKTKTEKNLARSNLEVYSISETDLLVKTITSKYITKTEVDSMLLNLDFVNSRLKSQVKYEIPNNLFK